MADGDDNSMTEAQLAACSDFFSASVNRFKENIEMLIGQPLACELGGVAAEEDAAIRVRMPVTGAACTLSVPGGGGKALLMIEPALAQTLLGLCRMHPEEEVAKARSDAAPLEDADLTDLEEVDNFLAAAFADEAQGRTKGAAGFEAGGVISIQDSTWKEGEDPLDAGVYVTMTGTLKIGEEPESDPFQLIFPIVSLQPIVPELLPEGAAPPPSAPQAGPAPETRQPGRAPIKTPVPADAPTVTTAAGGTVLCLASESLADALGAALSGTTTFVHQASTLLQVLESGTHPDLLVARVSADEGHVLRLLSALRRHPSMGSRPVLVLLETPTKRSVIRCGQLGLFDVLPADADAAQIRDRSSQLLAAARS